MTKRARRVSSRKRQKRRDRRKAKAGGWVREGKSKGGMVGHGASGSVQGKASAPAKRTKRPKVFKGKVIGVGVVRIEPIDIPD